MPPSASAAALGANVKIMADGMGVRRAQIHQIERLEASDAVLNQYETWLKRMECWSLDERERQFENARRGRRFSADQPEVAFIGAKPPWTRLRPER